MLVKILYTYFQSIVSRDGQVFMRRKTAKRVQLWQLTYLFIFWCAFYITVNPPFFFCFLFFGVRMPRAPHHIQWLTSQKLHMKIDLSLFLSTSVCVSVSLSIWLSASHYSIPFVQPSTCSSSFSFTSLSSIRSK